MKATPEKLADLLTGQGGLLAFPYHGTSMLGTFRPGDILLVTPIPLDAVRRGDVVAFTHGGCGGEDEIVVAHRVRRLTSDGLITQGDRCAAPDAEPVSVCNLLGQVRFVRRDGRMRTVQGGRPARVALGIARLRRRLASLARGPYRRFRARGLARHFWRPRLARVDLVIDGEPLVKYLHRQRIVACWWPNKKCFWCRKPYDLVIDCPESGS